MVVVPSEAISCGVSLLNDCVKHSQTVNQLRNESLDKGLFLIDVLI